MAIKFPYTMKCPKCSVGLKIKSADMIGKRIPCPKCKQKVEVVTPEEDGSIPYGVEAAPPPEKEPEPTEEELEAKEEQRRIAKRKKNWEQTKHILGILWLLALMGGFIGACYYFIYLGHGKIRGKDAEDEKL